MITTAACPQCGLKGVRCSEHFLFSTQETAYACPVCGMVAKDHKTGAVRIVQEAGDTAQQISERVSPVESRLARAEGRILDLAAAARGSAYAGGVDPDPAFAVPEYR